MIHLFCDRCGKCFQAVANNLECPACLYAAPRHRAVLGYAKRTPLIKKLVTT